jgi:hypothetical protein
MTTLKFKCELLSDVILNQKAASQSQNQTLDFIPGSCFLGIAADTLYKQRNYEFCREVFHSTKVKFGDAHPVSDNAKRRSLKIPACYLYPKGKKLNDACYISFIVDHDDEEIQKLQLKQAREDFFDVDGKTLTKVNIDTDVAVKSAYDREKRRSADEQMYCYESLAKGLVLYFEVVADDNFADAVSKALIGEKRIGRSRTAQYGLVEISDCKFDDVPSRASDKDYSVVYADSRLVFLDKYGYPTFQPTAKQLGFGEKDEIDWEKSQIRTFQYAPWNFQRQCFDADRCGIEKGSVFIVKTANSPTESQYVGNYQNEGFGKVIYNPDFVMDANDKGFCNYDFDLNVPEKKKPETKETRRKEIEQLQNSSDGLLNYLASMKKAELDEEIIYETVNEFVRENKKNFTQESFASQWGSIRAIAMRYSTYAELKEELFDKKITKNGKPEPYAYLTHGVAMEKWKKRGRFDVFRDFFNGLSPDGDFAQKVLINLAAQMAKLKN